MSKFAKLFDVAETQVLYILDEDDDGFPGIRMRTSVEGLTIQMMPTWRGTDEDVNLNKAEAAFQKLGREDAEAYFAKVSKMVSSMGGE